MVDDRIGSWAGTVYSTSDVRSGAGPRPPSVSWRDPSTGSASSRHQPRHVDPCPRWPQRDPGSSSDVDHRIRRVGAPVDKDRARGPGDGDGQVAQGFQARPPPRFSKAALASGFPTSRLASRQERGSNALPAAPEMRSRVRPASSMRVAFLGEDHRGLPHANLTMVPGTQQGGRSQHGSNKAAVEVPSRCHPPGDSVGSTPRNSRLRSPRCPRVLRTGAGLGGAHAGSRQSGHVAEPGENPQKATLNVVLRITSTNAVFDMPAVRATSARSGPSQVTCRVTTEVSTGVASSSGDAMTRATTCGLPRSNTQCTGDDVCQVGRIDGRGQGDRIVGGDQPAVLTERCDSHGYARTTMPSSARQTPGSAQPDLLRLGCPSADTVTRHSPG